MARHLMGEILGLWRSAAAVAGDRWRAKEEMREVDALDPQAKIPEFKACAVSIQIGNEKDLTRHEAMTVRGRY